jgi:hypothetical protein
MFRSAITTPISHCSYSQSPGQALRRAFLLSDKLYNVGPPVQARNRKQNDIPCSINNYLFTLQHHPYLLSWMRCCLLTARFFTISSLELRTPQRMYPVVWTPRRTAQWAHNWRQSWYVNGQKSQVVVGDWETAASGLMAAVSVLLAASSSLAAVSSLLTRGIGGGGGDSLGFLFDSHRGRGTRGSGGIEEELQRHLVLSHSIV